VSDSRYRNSTRTGDVLVAACDNTHVYDLKKFESLIATTGRRVCDLDLTGMTHGYC